jgi:hypothetical protein
LREYVYKWISASGVGTNRKEVVSIDTIKLQTEVREKIEGTLCEALDGGNKQGRRGGDGGVQVHCEGRRCEGVAVMYRCSTRMSKQSGEAV